MWHAVNAPGAGSETAIRAYPMDETINISSFIVRIIHSKTADGYDSYRGSVRHIQSNREFLFSNWDEALGFMKSYLPEGNGSLAERDVDASSPGDSNG